MIGRIQGKLLIKQAPYLLVDVQGVGYEIEAPLSTFYQLPEVGENVVLQTHLIVREDAHILCGFASDSERHLFRQLIKVSNVGAKLALGILSGMSVADFAQCVQQDNVRALTQLPGVGKKTAERLIVEMRDRFKDWDTASLQSDNSMPQSGVLLNKADQDALDALLALGYKSQEANRLLQNVQTEGMNSEEIIRAALKAAAG